MGDFLKSKQVLISITSMLILTILIVVGIFLFKGHNKNKLDYNPQETTNNYIAYIKINPLIKFELAQSCQNDDCKEPIIVNYELVNKDAKEIYEDIDFKNKTLLDIISTLADTVYNNGISFNNISIQTDWKDIYSSDEIEKAITDNSENKKTYNINIEIIEDLKNKEIVIEEIETKEFKTNQIIHRNSKEGKGFGDYNIIPIKTPGNNYNINFKLYGSENDISNIDINKLTISVDLKNYDCGTFDIRPTIENIDSNIYYTTAPNSIKVDLYRLYKINISTMTKNDVKDLLYSGGCNNNYFTFYYDNYGIASCSNEGDCTWDMQETYPKEIINYSTNWFSANFIGYSWGFKTNF